MFYTRVINKGLRTAAICRKKNLDIFSCKGKITCGKVSYNIYYKVHIAVIFLVFNTKYCSNFSP